MENQLLAAIPAAVYRRLLPDLEETTLRVDQTLFLPDAPMQFAYFPIDSTIAWSSARAAGTTAKAWPVGREGMAGISLVLDNRLALADGGRADVQAGGGAYRLSASALRREFRRSGALQHLLLRYVLAVVTQASQLSVCNLYHSVNQRVCRFLSRAFDRNGDKIFITQARMGTLLGVRREGISESAWRLQESGIIEYHRGHLTLVNRKALEAQACVCGGIIRQAFAKVTWVTPGCSGS